MAICSRFGNGLSILRPAVLADVKKFDGRKPDAHDKRRIEEGQYVIVGYDDNTEGLADLAMLKADGGWREIEEAAKAAGCAIA